MIARRLLVSGLAAAGLGACSGLLPGQGEPGPIYTLAPRTAGRLPGPPVGWQLLVDLPAAAAGLNSQRIALQPTPSSLQYLARAFWTDAVPTMVQGHLVEAFEGSGRIVAVARETVRLRPDFVLQSEIREFAAVYAPDAAQPPSARIRIMARLVRVADRSIVAAAQFEDTSRARGHGTEAIVGAFDLALAPVLDRIVEWTLRAPGAPARPAG